MRVLLDILEFVVMVVAVVVAAEVVQVEAEEVEALEVVDHGQGVVQADRLAIVLAPVASVLEVQVGSAHSCCWPVAFGSQCCC